MKGDGGLNDALPRLFLLLRSSALCVSSRHFEKHSCSTILTFGFGHAILRLISLYTGVREIRSQTTEHIMAAISVISGTQPTSLGHRLLSLLRRVPDTGTVRRIGTGNHGSDVASNPVNNGLYQPTSLMDPLDDLQNATWEDAEWQ
jgi:hypothetical protein